MGDKCHTNSNEEWTSKINGTSDGAFTVDSEDNDGNFAGKHTGEDIVGNCSGTEINYLRPNNKARYYYAGTFYDDGNSIRGTRKLLRANGSVRALDDDEWTGTKTTLIETESSRKP